MKRNFLQLALFLLTWIFLISVLFVSGEWQRSTVLLILNPVPNVHTGTLQPCYAVFFCSPATLFFCSPATLFFCSPATQFFCSPATQFFLVLPRCFFCTNSLKCIPAVQGKNTELIYLNYTIFGNVLKSQKYLLISNTR